MIEMLDNIAPAGHYILYRSIHMHTFSFASNACLILQFNSCFPFFVPSTFRPSETVSGRTCLGLFVLIVGISGRQLTALSSIAGCAPSSVTDCAPPLLNIRQMHLAVSPHRVSHLKHVRRCSRVVSVDRRGQVRHAYSNLLPTVWRTRVRLHDLFVPGCTQSAQHPRQP